MYFVRDFIYSKIDYVWVKVQGEIVDGKWLTYNPLSKEDIENFKQEYSHKAPIQETVLELIKPALTNWLSSFNETLRSDFDIFESPSWVEFAMSNSCFDGMNETTIYNNTIQGILNNNIDIKLDDLREGNDFKIIIAKNGSCNVIYSQHTIGGKKYYLII